MKDLWKAALLLVVVVVVVVALAAGRVGRGGDGGPGPGSPAVYGQIEAASDCAELQQMFNQASANNDRATAGTDQFDWTLGYMTAADARMKGLGCYG